MGYKTIKWWTQNYGYNSQPILNANKTTKKKNNKETDIETLLDG